jgi:hypothetical protein
VENHVYHRILLIQWKVTEHKKIYPGNAFANSSASRLRSWEKNGLWHFTAFHQPIMSSYEDVEIVTVAKVNKAEKADWSNDNKYALIIAVLDLIQTRGGCDDSNGFKKKEWLEIMKSFNRSAGVNYNKQQLQSQLSILKSAYSTFKKVKENSGFGWWNSTLQIPTAPDDVWDNYISSHPDAAKYRKETLPCFEELNQIFSGKCATGNYAMSSYTPPAGTPVAAAAPVSDEGGAMPGKIEILACVYRHG